MVKYFEQGDFVYMDFCPQAGHEQAGRRPALVVSSTVYNSRSNMTMVCPITNTDRCSPVHVSLGNDHIIRGFVMCDQAKFLDLNQRNAEFAERADEAVICAVISIIQSLVERD